MESSANYCQWNKHHTSYHTIRGHGMTIRGRLTHTSYHTIRGHGMTIRGRLTHTSYYTIREHGMTIRGRLHSHFIPYHQGTWYDHQGTAHPHFIPYHQGHGMTIRGRLHSHLQLTVLTAKFHIHVDYAVVLWRIQSVFFLTYKQQQWRSPGDLLIKNSKKKFKSLRYWIYTKFAHAVDNIQCVYIPRVFSIQPSLSFTHIHTHI